MYTWRMYVDTYIYVAHGVGSWKAKHVFAFGTQRQQKQSQLSF